MFLQLFYNFLSVLPYMSSLPSQDMGRYLAGVRALLIPHIPCCLDGNHIVVESAGLLVRQSSYLVIVLIYHLLCFGLQNFSNKIYELNSVDNIFEF